MLRTSDLVQEARANAPEPEVEVKEATVEVSIAVFENVLDFKPLIEWLSAI
jgi:hypothetical protein